MNRRLGLGLAVSVGLSACASLAPPHERPAAPVAVQFPLAPPGDAGPPAAERPWRSFFGADVRLQRLIERALQNNRDLRVAVLNIETARAQLNAREADRLPTVQGAVSASRQPGGNGRVGSTYTAGIGVSAWELDFFGRVRSATDAALAQLAATADAREAAHIALVAAVANAHYALAADDELIALTRAALASREETQRLMRLRFDNGASSEIDWRAAQSAAEAARATLIGLERQRLVDLNALTLLVGEPLPPDLPLRPVWNPMLLADVPAGLPPEVLLQRPDVRQAENQLRAANANIGVARAAFWPRITLTGSIGVASTELSGLFSGGTAWSFAPQLLAPLFDAGRNRANLRLSEAQRGIAVAQYERAVQAAYRDVADALAGRATLSEQLAATRTLAEAEAARFRLSELRLRNGIASSLELLDAQRSLLAAQQQRVQVELALLQNRIAAYRALGGGWRE
jgi:NodT family efflux transporter outer membrane factor (OMF) lipoprotein